MGTVTKLKNAKDKLKEAEAAMPGDYESRHTDSVDDRLGAIAKENAEGFDYNTGADSYKKYMQNAAQNARNGAAAATATAQGLAGGYGADWAQSAAGQAAEEQTGNAHTALADLRSKALQQWQNELAGNAQMADTLLGQDSLERSAAAQDTGNAQAWRDYLYGRVGQARQENSDFWDNVWNTVKGIGSAVKAGYDGYMGYSQQKLVNEVAGQQLAWEAYDAGDPERAKQILKTYGLDEGMVDQWKDNYTIQQNKVNTMNQALAFMKEGSLDAARETLTQAGMDTAIVDNWQGLSDVDKEKLDYQLSAMEAEYKYRNDTGVSNFLEAAGIDPGSIDYSGTLNQRDIEQQLAQKQALQQFRQKYGASTSSSSGRRSSGSSSGSRRTSSTGSSKSGSGFTNAQLKSMAKDFSSMKSTDPLYAFYKQTLTDAGWLTDSRLSYGQNVVNQSLASGKSQSSIMDQLMNQGFTDDEIARFFNNAK